VPDVSEPSDWTRVGDARLAAILIAIDGTGLGGVSLRGRSGGAREAWLDLLRELLPATTRLRRLPAHITDDRLLGGLDLAATLAAGKPIVERGILADSDGGLLLVPLAERMSPAVAARIVAAMDKGEVAMERDSLTQRLPARFGVIALDEGIGDDERLPAALLDRLACHVNLDEISDGDFRDAKHDTSIGPEEIVQAKDRLRSVAVTAETIEALCGVALALGIGSLNAPLRALKAARCLAALRGHAVVDDEDVATAARLVLAPRATRIPLAQNEEEQDLTPQDQEQQDVSDPEPPEAPEQPTPSAAELQEIVLAAAQAAIPRNLLARLVGRQSPRSHGSASGRAGQRQRTRRRGRPAGTRRGDLRAGERLNVLETLRAAAPWQRLRIRVQPGESATRRLEVRSEDFRIKRLKDRRETVTIFVVDASGSSAVNRLAEAKGAVELLLADCYVRRDEVALLSFGGRGVELLLPPTRSLTRAKRCLADLPGGGGTPLAKALEEAASLAIAIRRKHQTPTVVVLTDGRPNIARDGSKGREAAERDAIGSACALRETGIAVLLVDTSQRAGAGAERFAEAMGAQYLPLPYADARTLSEEVKARIGSPA